MKEKSIDKKFIIIAVILIICTLFFINFLHQNLRASLLFKKALDLNKPTVKSEKIKYYKGIFSLLSQAIRLNNTNAEYPAKKADFIVDAIKENLGNDLSITESEAENLYIRAINLNPTNFNYHLKLGWFYGDFNNIKAEEELRKSANLFPSYYEIYIYLFKYYLRNKEAGLAFGSLLSTVNLSNANVIYVMRHELKWLSNLYIDEEKRKFKFVIHPHKSEIDFKKYNFPHVNIPLGIKVFIKKSPFNSIRLYRNNYSAAPFNFVEDINGLGVYQLELDQKTETAFLDELKIKVSPAYPIEKVEFAIKY